MALEAYRSKRNFAATAEPRGRAPHEMSDIFVVQKHDATRLHYDFRLALDGVSEELGGDPRPEPGPRRKAARGRGRRPPAGIRRFRGNDRRRRIRRRLRHRVGPGRVDADRRSAQSLEEGPARLRAARPETQGSLHLVRMRAKPREKRENWLLIKGDDEFVRPAGAADILDERPESVKTGRSIEDLAGEPPGWSSKTDNIEKTEGSRAEAAKPGSRTRKRAASPRKTGRVWAGPLDERKPAKRQSDSRRERWRTRRRKQATFARKDLFSPSPKRKGETLSAQPRRKLRRERQNCPTRSKGGSRALSIGSRTESKSGRLSNRQFRLPSRLRSKVCCTNAHDRLAVRSV